MMESAYLCVILHTMHKKITIYRDFNLFSNSWYNPRWRPRWRPLLVMSQTSSSATTHKIYLILLRRSKAFHQRRNRFEMMQHIKNSGEGSINSPPPTPLVPRWGVNLRVRPRVEIERKRYIHTAPNKFLTRNRLNRTKIKTSCRLKVLYKQNILNGSVWMKWSVKSFSGGRRFRPVPWGISLKL